MDFKESWTVENALKVLEHPTVDSKLWAEAVEWLMLHGPEEVKALLLEASGNATHSCFPEIQAESYTKEGTPCYNISDLAHSLGIDEEKVREILIEKEKVHGVRHSVDSDEVYKVQ